MIIPRMIRDGIGRITSDKCPACGSHKYYSGTCYGKCYDRKRQAREQARKDEAKIRARENTAATYTSALLDLHARRMRNAR